MESETQSAMGLALVRDARFLAHAPQGFHPERPERLAAAERGVEGLHAKLVPVPARAATLAELQRVHDADYLRRLETRLSGPPGYLDPDTYFGLGTREAAWFAAGGACALVEALLEGPTSVGALLCRPPGHHATRDQAMGFCLLNNVAVGAAHARALGVERVAIVDWDVHHGNGTQDIFWDDPSVLFISMHQSPLYPHTGHALELGGEGALGRTVNLPFLKGSNGESYARAFQRVVLPLLRAFRPGLILISAGFDAHVRDPLAGMRLDDAAYRWMSSRLAECARELGHGRVGLVLEGGYDLTAVEDGVRASLSGLVSPCAQRGEGETAKQPAMEASLTTVLDALAPHWPGAFESVRAPAPSGSTPAR